MDSVLGWISRYGYVGLFASLMLGIAGLPIPDETILVFCGFLIARGGSLQPVPTFAVGVLGSICGISLSYVIGRTLGHAVIYRYGGYVRVKPEDIDRVHQWFRRTGEWLLTVGYFIPGVRHFTALVAGMSGLEYRIFALFAYSGAMIWVATFLAIGYLVGDRWREVIEIVRRYTLLSTLALAAVVAIWWYVRKRLRF